MPRHDSFDYVNLGIQMVVAVGTVGAVLVAIFGDWFRIKFASPELSIEIPDHFGVLGKTLDGSHSAFYFHLRVRNSRPRCIARKCRVLLREVRRSRDNGPFELLLAPVPIQFCWAPRNFEPLEPDIIDEKMLDFGSVNGNESLFVPSLAVILASYEGFVSPRETVQYFLRLSADSYLAKRDYIIEVWWDGVWSEDSKTMAQHLTIKIVNQ